MNGIVCAHCFSYLPTLVTACPSCGQEIIVTDPNKTVIDKILPNCLIHRYEGSDLLEPAIILKEGKVNYKVATQLKDYPHPITVAKNKVYHFDQSLFSSIQALRNERTTSMYHYDSSIKTHWQQLKPFAK